MQANKCTNKANSVLEFIRRTVGPQNPELFSKLYKSLVRPILQYCSPGLVSAPQKRLTHLGEGTTYKAAFKCALGNIGPDMSYEERLTKKIIFVA